MPDDPTNPGTEAFVPDFGDSEDTGEHSVPIVASSDDTGQQSEPGTESEAESVGTAVHPVAVPGRYQYLKWWKAVLVILGVWFAAAQVGLGLFYWWFHTIDKTAAVFVVLVYVVACAVAGVMLAMMQGRPLISALSIAVLSAPFASVAAAAPLYGYYFCAHTGHCLIGVIPY